MLFALDYGYFHYMYLLMNPILDPINESKTSETRTEDIMNEVQRGEILSQNLPQCVAIMKFGNEWRSQQNNNSKRAARKKRVLLEEKCMTALSSIRVTVLDLNIILTYNVVKNIFLMQL